MSGPLGDDTPRWRGMTHEEIWAMVSGKPAHAASQYAEGQWHATWFDIHVVDARLSRAIAEAGSGWEGAAAEAMTAGVTPLGAWALDAAEKAKATARTLGMQGESSSYTRDQMPEPRHADMTLAAPDGIGITRRFLEDWQAADVERDNAARRAQELMETYTVNSYDTISGFEESPPPPAVVLTGGTGGSPAHGLGIGASGGPTGVEAATAGWPTSSPGGSTIAPSGGVGSGVGAAGGSSGAIPPWAVPAAGPSGRGPTAGQSGLGPTVGSPGLGPAAGQSGLGPTVGSSGLGPAAGPSGLGAAAGQSGQGPAAGQSGLGPAAGPSAWGSAAGLSAGPAGGVGRDRATSGAAPFGHGAAPSAGAGGAGWRGGVGGPGSGAVAAVEPIRPLHPSRPGAADRPGQGTAGPGAWRPGDPPGAGGRGPSGSWPPVGSDPAERGAPTGRGGGGGRGVAPPDPLPPPARVDRGSPERPFPSSAPPAEEPTARSGRTGTTGHPGLMPMGAGAGAGTGDRRHPRPGYLVEDADVFTDHRWVTPHIVNEEQHHA